MDPHRFEELLRSLAEAPSRRSIVRLLVGSTVGSRIPLAAIESEAHNALLKCKKLTGERKKKCVKKAKKHMKTHLAPAPPGCTQNCAGKDCGPDGCGGLCGACDGGSSCSNGTCVCPEDMEACKGECAALCPADTVRHPETCDCCLPANRECDRGGFCCSDKCIFIDNDIGSSCDGQHEGESCQFGGQCYSTLCTNGICRCPSHKEPCRGGCYDPCPPGKFRNLTNCICQEPITG